MFAFSRFAKISVPVAFMSEGEYVVQSGSLNHSLYDGDNLLHQEVKTIDEATSDRFEYNHSLSLNEGELRYLTLASQINEFFKETHIIIYKASLLVKGVAEVRKVLGLTDNELRDEEIPLATTYCQMVTASDSGLLVAIAADLQLKNQFSELCVVKTALDFIDSLSLRLSKSEKTDNKSFTRLANADQVERLKTSLENRKNGLMLLFSEWYTESDEAFDPTGLFTVVTMAKRSQGE